MIWAGIFKLTQWLSSTLDFIFISLYLVSRKLRKIVLVTIPAGPASHRCPGRRCPKRILDRPQSLLLPLCLSGAAGRGRLWTTFVTSPSSGRGHTRSSCPHLKHWGFTERTKNIYQGTHYLSLKYIHSLQANHRLKICLWNATNFASCLDQPLIRSAAWG